MKLLICIVPHDKGDMVSQITRTAGAPGGTLILGRGTARNQWLDLLGLADTRKELLYTLIPAELLPGIQNALRDTCNSQKKGFGIMFSMEVESFIRTNDFQQKEGTQMENATHTLISVIVNSGYAEEAMAAARKAGAFGGTILNARGTVRAEDADFFGINIVPEKEMLLILAEKDKARPLIDAIKTEPYLQEKGSGIMFCMPVTSFETLGSK